MLLDALRSLQNKWMKWLFSAIGAAVLICTSFVYSDIAEENRAITFNKVYPPSRASSDLTAGVDENHSLFSNHRLPPFESLAVKRVYERQGSLTTGILLEFQRWPNLQEEKKILKVTNKAGLTQIEVEQGGGFKTWVFDWPYITYRGRAIEACESFPEEIHQILRHCSSNSIGYPD